MNTSKDDLFEIINYSCQLFRMKDPVQITSPDAVTPELIDMMFGDRMYIQEEIHAMYLDNSKNLCYTERIGMGSLSAAVVNEMNLWSTMIQQRTQSVIVIHNHPSGHREFSQADIKLAQKLSRSALTLGLDITDFLIVLPNKHVISGVNRGIL